MASKVKSTITFEAEGLKEAIRRLEKMDADVTRGLELICHAGAQVIQNEAKRLAPLDSIENSIDRWTVAKKEHAVEVDVGPTVFYARFFEVGAVAHPIAPRRKKAVMTPEGPRAIVPRHPGIAKWPFLRPAADTKAKDARNAMDHKVEEIIDRA